MMKAYWKDIWRTVSNEKKRFLSIVVIVTLGVTMMCGLRASCEDLRSSADQFFDEQNLFDIQVLSTLGLTDEDIKELKKVGQVVTAEGGYNETVYTMVDNVRKSIDLRTLSREQLNIPYLQEGRMPETDSEIVVARSYWLETGNAVGDVIHLEEEPDGFKSKDYTITGIVIDSLDINSTEGSMGFRSTATTDYVGYVLPEASDSDVYSIAYLSIDGGTELNCYTKDYSDAVDEVVHEIETKIKEQREIARYDEVYGDAMKEWQVGRDEADEEFAKAEKKIADAKKELADGKKEIADAKKEIADGKKELIDGESELNKQETKANKELKKAWKQIADGYDEIELGEKELADAKKELKNGQKQLDKAKEELKAQEKAAEVQFTEAKKTLEEQRQALNAGYAEYESGYAQYEAGYVQWENGHSQWQSGYANWETEVSQFDTIKETLDEETRANMEAQFLAAEQQLLKTKLELDAVKSQLDVSKQQLEAAKEQLDAGKVQLEASKAELDKQEELVKIQFTAGWTEIEKNQTELEEGQKEIESGLKELKKGKAELANGKKELASQEAAAAKEFEKARAEIADGWQEIKDGEKEIKEGERDLVDGEKELADAIMEYEKEKEKAEKELDDGLEEINKIDMTKWYVQDRKALSGYNNVKSDADSIQAIGDIFPVLFLVVAILISLTTITRMVEEERGLIGTYKALGFTNAEIRRKYLIYSVLACFIGGILGFIAGYIILPSILFIVFKIMYLLPEYKLQLNCFYGFCGILFFEVGVVGATLYSCRRALMKPPAVLMRPKAPKSGTRVLLERITFIWKRLSFLNKVTARNLFRYKKRLFMTVFGIAGCTALLLCGFTIKDTVAEMLPQQYEVVYKYDLMAVTDSEDMDELKAILEEDEEIDAYLPIGMQMTDLYNQAGKKESVQLIVIPEGASLEKYIHLKTKAGEKVELGENDVIITRNATRTLNLSIGDTVKMQNMDLKEVETQITQIVENYFGNSVYMTEQTYKKLFGTFEENAVYAQFTDACEDDKAYTEKLKREEIILSANCTQAMKDEFASAFRLLNMVVVVILVLAAALAFAVLFTLSNTNISERERELATIKVLGFYHIEVHSYVNKETWILTTLGILAGMPLGWLLGRYVMGILKLSSLEFYIDLYPISYLYAAVITVVFGIIVNTITNKVLDKINMVEALKSVE